MSITWWQYLAMGVAALFIHPILMLWELVSGRCRLDVAVSTAFRSFLAPAAILMLPRTVPEHVWMAAVVIGWWACNFVDGVTRMTRNYARMLLIGPIVDEAMERAIAAPMDPVTMADLKQQVYSIAMEVCNMNLKAGEGVKGPKVQNGDCAKRDGTEGTTCSKRRSGRAR